MMALDGKTIKEEIPDKEIFENSIRRTKGNEQCPDSPEGAKVIAPRSPISSLMPLTSKRNLPHNGSISPTNGTTTPPSTTPTPNNVAQHETQRLQKIRRFLGALIQFGQDTNHDVGERLHSLVLSLTSGGLTIDDFQIAVQEATNFPLRPNVLPFLRLHLPLLQREVNSLSRACKQSPLQYVRANESSVLEMLHNSTEHSDIFEGGVSFSANNNGLNLKRRATDSLLYEPHLTNNTMHDWSEISPSKRPHHLLMTSSTSSAIPQLYTNHPSLFEYQNGILQSHQEQMQIHRDERESRTMQSDSNRSRLSQGGGGGDEEWKNIHTMLSCISGMVEKTKRAISILQQRGNDTVPPTLQDTSLISDIKRQTEEKIAEFRRSAEDSVNQVKRQAMLEIQRAVATAETRAIEMIAQERMKMEKIYSELNRHSDDADAQISGQNACWNCGRKATETCSGCNLARYCGAFCQHKDWESHHHACGNNISRGSVGDNQLQQVQQKTASIIRTSLTTSSSNTSNSSRSSPQISAANANGAPVQ